MSQHSIVEEPQPERAQCTLCAATESIGFYTGCMLKDGHCKDSEWECDGKGNLTKQPYWLNPITGCQYRWNPKVERWVSTGHYPLGMNPLDF